MSTPQDPADPAGEHTPQDPADPQNPYGTPPQPGAPVPPAAPVHGAGPSQPAYGQPPQQPYPQAQSQQPYSQPDEPQQGYPQQPSQQPFPAYAGQPGGDEPSKALAITALVLSFFGCVVIGALIAIPMAIIVLLRGRDGRNHGKGLAIAAIILSVLTLAVPVVAVVAGVSYVNGLTDVNDLEEGDCLDADGLTDSASDTVTDIEKVSCSEDHDGEVLATDEVTAEQADDAASIDTTAVCAPAIEAAGKSAVVTDGIQVTALTVAEPEEGDTIACIAYNADGSELTSRLGS
jgi:preprotein translocase subunit Sss1